VRIGGGDARVAGDIAAESIGAPRAATGRTGMPPSTRHRAGTAQPRLAYATAVVMLFAGHAAAAMPPAPTRSDCDMPGFARTLSAGAPAEVPPARAHWLDRGTIRWPGAPLGGRYRLHHAQAGGIVATPGRAVAGADGAVELSPFSAMLPRDLAARFAFVGDGIHLAFRDDDRARLPTLLQGQLVLVREDAAGTVLDATGLQHAAVLDDLYAGAAQAETLGVTVTAGGTRFALWAPTARGVALCLYDDADAPATKVRAARRDDASGTWTLAQPADLSGRYYTYLVDVFVPGTGLVRNRVTDPYSIGLNADSRRSWVGDPEAPSLKPEGWEDSRAPVLAAQTDMVIYELHVRDFSIHDATVPARDRGKYLGFTHAGSDGMRHLRAIARAGMTDVHLLPVFDIATIPEAGCVTPEVPDAPPDSERQQATVMAVAADDCFNWGYDPFHFDVPEGSYASDPNDAATRIVEFRRMVMALHDAGLRVGMDVVYNHTSASGQHPKSVLDRIVPGYYHRLDADGRVTQSTCCENTATEHAMMAKLMIDSTVRWTRHYRIDSFRFDLMGHHPREAMERLQAAVDAAAGRRVHLIGEGWNFGEVADGARFVQASQLSLAGSGIGTFSDRARDALRGGGPADAGEALLREQGWLNGLVYAPNAHADPGRPRADLLHAADLARAGLAGTLRDFELDAGDGRRLRLDQLDYKGQPAGYASQPGEVVNYVENHDNQTLFDINVFKLPRDASREDRARVQVLGMAHTAFSQGIAYFHAGIEALRSKSLDRNSYNSGDWFNRFDWTFRDNFFGSGLPPAQDNRDNWPLMRPLLADPAIKPAPAHIAFARDAFLDLLRIRASTPLFRLREADEVKRRLTFPDGGPGQNPVVLVGRLDGEGLDNAAFEEVLYFINASPDAQTLTLPDLAGTAYALHPVHLADGAADPRPRELARHDAATGTFVIPARTGMVYVRH
jgi:pullulanase